MKGLTDHGLLALLDEVTGSSCPELSLVCVELYPPHSVIIHCVQVASVVYDYLDRRNEHESLLGTKHFSQLVNYLISNNRLNALLHAILTKGRYIAESGVQYKVGIY